MGHGSKSTSDTQTNGSHDMDLTELLGGLLQRGMTESSQDRIDKSLNDDALAQILKQEFGVSRPAAPAEAIVPAQTRIPTTAPVRVPVTAPAAPGSGLKNRPIEAPREREASGKSADGGLGDLGGLFGKSFKQAAGAGALALLASIALKALRGSSPKGASQLESAAGLLGGLRDEDNPQQQQQVQSLADLTIKAMINAAKADGRIDEDELQKIIGELKGGEFTAEERDFLLNEVRKPMCTAEIVRAVPNRQVGAQIYAASLLAIEVDSPAEEAYLQQLARDVGLDSQVVEEIHSVLGAP
jgi:uncharacterized membrane protein YebE (DUF533 family)